MKKLTITFLVLTLAIGFGVSFSNQSLADSHEDVEEVTLKAIGGLSSPYARVNYFGPDAGDLDKAKEEISEEFLNSYALISYNNATPDQQVYLDTFIPPFTDLQKEQMLALTSGQPYDFLVMDAQWLGQYAEGGYLKDDYSESYKEWAEEYGMYESFKEGSMYKGKMYGIWRETSTRALWVWKDVLHAAGYTMEDIESAEGLVEALPDIKETAEEEFDMSGAMEYRYEGDIALDWWYGWLYQLGGSIAEKNEDGEWRAGFDNEAGYEATNYLKKLDEAGADLKRTWQSNLVNFLNRDYAMTFSGSWNVSNIDQHFSNKEPEEYNEEVGMIPQPTFEGEEMRTLTGGFSMVIPESAQHPDLVHEILMEHLFRADENYALQLAKNGLFPTSEKIFQNPRYEEEMLKSMPKEWYNKYREAVSGGVVRPGIPEYSQIKDILWEGVESVVSGQSTAEKALSEAAEEVNNLLEE